MRSEVPSEEDSPPNWQISSGHWQVSCQCVIAKMSAGESEACGTRLGDNLRASGATFASDATPVVSDLAEKWDRHLACRFESADVYLIVHFGSRSHMKHSRDFKGRVRMHVMFLHQNFPAQFCYMAPRLANEHGWRCTFVTSKVEGQLPGVEKLVYTATGGATKSTHFCSRNFENCVHEAHAVFETLKPRRDIQPDLVVAHTGFGSSLFLPYLYDAPIINFAEYFYRPIGGDIGFRPEMPVMEEALLRIKTKNAMIMLDLDNCDRAWTPTHYQRDYFPAEYRSKFDVIFDGIDTGIYYRRHNPERRLPNGQVVPSGTRIVTYVARGFERMRGFDIFMEVARRTYEQFPNVLFVVVGADSVHYGPDLAYTDKASFREEVLSSGKYDLSKFLFTGRVPEHDLAQILSLGDLHIYLTEPFIASWSLVDAMSCGAVVLASDQNCVREYIRPGENGLLKGFFDVEGLAAQAVDVLKDPAAFKPLSIAAQETVQQKYSVDVAMPKLKAFFEQVAAKKREPSNRLDVLVREGTLKLVEDEDEVSRKKKALRSESRTGNLPVLQSSSSSTGAVARSNVGSNTEARAGANADGPMAHPTKPSGSTAIGPSAKGTPPRGVLFKRLPNLVDDPALAQAIDTLEMFSKDRSTAKEWVDVCFRFSAPAPYESFGVQQHPIDLTRFMQRAIEWAPRRVLDLGPRGAGTTFLWTRAASPDARIVVVGTPQEPLKPEQRPLFESLACEVQTVNFVPTPATRNEFDKELTRLRGFRQFDIVFLNGQRPITELVVDYNIIVKHVRSGGLIAWDGVRTTGPLDPLTDGGTLLWRELKPRFPRQAEYLDGRDSPTGAIVAVVIP